jgi:hypothetical protein
MSKPVRHSSESLRYGSRLLEHNVSLLEKPFQPHESLKFWGPAITYSSPTRTWSFERCGRSYSEDDLRFRIVACLSNSILTCGNRPLCRYRRNSGESRQNSYPIDKPHLSGSVDHRLPSLRPKPSMEVCDHAGKRTTGDVWMGRESGEKTACRILPRCTLASHASSGITMSSATSC